jgi:hypothetical protein
MMTPGSIAQSQGSDRRGDARRDVHEAHVQLGFRCALRGVIGCRAAIIGRTFAQPPDNRADHATSVYVLRAESVHARPV